MTMFFAVLILIRLLNVEQRVSDYMRDIARIENVYDERRSVQNILVVLIIIMICVVAFILRHRMMKHGNIHPAMKMILISRFAVAAMIVLILMRMISLHMIDALLYRGGPLRMNYILDFAATSLIAWSAWNYRRCVDRPGRGRRS